MGRLKGASKSDLFLMDPEEIEIVTDPKHPLYDERAELEPEEKFILNVMARGVIQPITVRRNGEGVEVVAGRQRVRAAREANKRLTAEGKEPIKVPFRIARATDAELFGMTISENEIRRGDGMLTKARKLQRFLDMGRSAEEAAIAFGVSRAAVSQWQKLLDLDAKVQASVEAGRISASAAAQLADLPREEQREKLKEIEAEGAPQTTEQVRARAKGAPAIKKPGKKILMEAIASEETPDEARDVLKWVVGETQTRPW